MRQSGALASAIFSVLTVSCLKGESKKKLFNTNRKRIRLLTLTQSYNFFTATAPFVSTDSKRLPLKSKDCHFFVNNCFTDLFAAGSYT